MQFHASCIARQGRGLLLLGQSGSGKSDLALRLIGRGFTLVADDRVDVESGCASPPDGLAGLIEVRGLGIVRLAFEAPVRLALVLVLDETPARLPAPAMHPSLHLPVIAFDPWTASAGARATLAFECALDRARCVAGAFAV